MIMFILYGTCGLVSFTQSCKSVWRRKKCILLFMWQWGLRKILYASWDIMLDYWLVVIVKSLTSYKIKIKWKHFWKENNKEKLG